MGALRCLYAHLQPSLLPQPSVLSPARSRCHVVHGTVPPLSTPIPTARRSVSPPALDRARSGPSARPWAAPRARTSLLEGRTSGPQKKLPEEGGSPPPTTNLRPTNRHCAPQFTVSTAGPYVTEAACIGQRRTQVGREGARCTGSKGPSATERWEMDSSAARGSRRKSHNMTIVRSKSVWTPEVSPFCRRGARGARLAPQPLGVVSACCRRPRPRREEFLGGTAPKHDCSRAGPCSECARSRLAVTANLRIIFLAAGGRAVEVAGRPTRRPHVVGHS